MPCLGSETEGVERLLSATQKSADGIVEAKASKAGTAPLSRGCKGATSRACDLFGEAWQNTNFSWSSWQGQRVKPHGPASQGLNHRTRDTEPNVRCVPSV